MRAETVTKPLVGAAVLMALGEEIFGTAIDSRPISNLLALVISSILIVVYIWVLLHRESGSPTSAAAGLWDRLWAFFADYMIASGIIWPLPAYLTALHEDWRKAFLVGLVLLAGYFTLSQFLVSRSPGSVLQGIGLQYDSGEAPSFLAALGRVVLSYIALCLWIVSVPMAISDSGKRMWQDKAFGTRVVQWSD